MKSINIALLSAMPEEIGNTIDLSLSKGFTKGIGVACIHHQDCPSSSSLDWLVYSGVLCRLN